MAHERQTGAAVLRVGRDQVRVELGAELRVAAPVGELVGVVDLRARLAPASAMPLACGAHHARDRAELDPAREQLGVERASRRARRSRRCPSPRSPIPERPMLSAWRTAERGRRSPSRSSGRRPRPPARTARRRSSPERWKRTIGRRRAARARTRRSGTGAGSGCGATVPGGAVGGARVERRVLAEVLHPAVVAVGDRLVERPTRTPRARRRW